MQPVLINGFALIAHRRRPILVGVLIFAGILGAAAQTSNEWLWSALFAGRVGLVGALIVLALFAALRYHPAALVARPQARAFATPVNPSPVFLAAAFTILAGFPLSEAIGDMINGEDLWTENVPGPLWILVVALHWYVAWGWPGVHLQPDGVLNRLPLGTMFVPWEAFAPDFPAVPSGDNKLALYYQQPELVRRRGIHPRKQSLPASADAAYLARVIHEYVQHPEHRPALGTEAELRRLAAALGETPERAGHRGAYPARPVRERNP